MPRPSTPSRTTPRSKAWICPPTSSRSRSRDPMAQTAQQQRTSHPLAAYNFQVSVDGVAMRFAKISGLAREHRTLTYRDGLSFREGEQITKFQINAFSPVTLERGTVLGDKFLSTWLER